MTASPKRLLDHHQMTASSPLRILITAGPTHEPLDRVRYLANRSSGRMGLALVEASIARDLPVTLLLGPITINPPDSSLLTVERFHTARDLERLLVKQWPQHDVLIMAAAVADYRPRVIGTNDKIARGNAPITLTLEPTPDLIAAAARTSRIDQILIGFALEPEDRLDRAAHEKLARKGLDAIVANPLETMDAERVTAALHLRSGDVLHSPANLSKRAFADWLLDQIPLIRAQPHRA